MAFKICRDILSSAKQQGARIVTAESCTAGMLAAALTDLPGSSEVFERGFVTYSNQSKIDLLDVSADSLRAYGAVSEEVAREMARGALACSPATIALSITGIAGPGGSEYKPEGRVCFGIAANKKIDAFTQEFGALGRENVRQAATHYALSMLKSALSH